MAKFPEVPESEANPSEIRGKLIKRLAFAGLLVAGLLGVLAFFDYLTTPSDEPEVQVFTRPVPVAPKKEVSQPLTPASNLPPPPGPVEPVPAPVADVPPPPSVAVHKPESAVDPLVAHNETRAARPATEVAPKAQLLPKPAPRIARQPQFVPENTEPPIADYTPSPVASQPKASARVIETKTAPVPAVVPPTPQRLFSGFIVQAGVFSSAERAEELHARLSLSGVPSTLETRVQVGPFKTRQEAEAAQAKLKDLGIESVLVAPKGRR